MNNYTPDYWLVLKIITKDEVMFKVFATWVSSFTKGESWQLNSGIVDVEVSEKVISFIGFFGSKYTVANHEFVYRTSAYTQSVLQQIISNSDKQGAKIEVMPFETNWLELNYLKPQTLLS
jgi:hypothetical protein